MTPENVIIIILDTARASDLCSIQNGAPATFSELGSLGSDFTSAYATAPWSLPSHASLFTGTYSSYHGAHADHKQLPSEPITLAETFQRADYETAAISNNTWISEEFGFARGFDTFHKTWQYVQSDTDLGEVARSKEGTAKLRAVAKKLTKGNTLTNIANAIYGQFFRKQQDDGAKQTNEWVSDWLQDRDDASPFFLFINYLEPHLEYRPLREFTEEFLPTGVSYDDAMDIPQDAWSYMAEKTEMTDRDFEILWALYRAELAYLDHRIGELKASLKEADEWEETIFVVTGDHGENIGDHGLMDHQYCLYDTLLHVPLIIHGGAFTGGGESDSLVQLTDLAPTLLDAVGIDAPEVREQFQGTSFHPNTDTEPREYAIAEYLAPQPSMDALEKRVGELPEKVYKYDRSLRTIRSKEHKLIRGSDNTRELYDVVQDSEERRNLVDEEPEIANRLEAELDSWLNSFDHADATGSVSMTQSTQDRLEDLGYLQ